MNSLNHFLGIRGTLKVQMSSSPRGTWTKKGLFKGVVISFSLAWVNKPVKLKSLKVSLTSLMTFYITLLGKRRCIGEVLARAEMFLMFCAILSRFRLSVAYPVGRPPSLDYELGMLFYPKSFDVVAAERK